MMSKMLLSWKLWLACVACISAREIDFPPVLGVQSFQERLRDDDGIDISTGSDFHGLMTFANLPYANCFKDSHDDTLEGDIFLLGAPFDTGLLYSKIVQGSLGWKSLRALTTDIFQSVTARPGARFGPTGIRQGSRRMGARGGWSIYTGENSFSSWATIVDCGDAPLTFLDNTIALKQLEKAHRVVSARKAKASSKSSTPRIIALGGDHTTTLPALRSAASRWGKISVIHFDSHIDTWDPKLLGGGITEYISVNHGTFLHLAHEEGLVRNTSIHAGIRAPLLRPKGDLRNDVRCGFDMIKARDIDRIGVDGIIKQIKGRVAETPVYISVDIDVLDPAFAPATGTAEVGGWTTRELLSILDGLEGLNVVGADVVEVAPIYDNPGETTVLAAAEVVHSLLTLMVQKPVKST